MELLLIRHGSVDRSDQRTQTADGWPDPDLSDLGCSQAEQLGRRLESYPFQRIYASDLKRAVHTAQILVSHVPAPLEICAGLREIHMGRLHTEHWPDLEEAFPGYYEQWRRHTDDLPYPEGESGADVSRRAFPVIQKILSTGLDRVAVVAHGGVIRVLLCCFLGIGQEKRFQFGDPLVNCSLTSVHWDAETRVFSVNSFTETSHLS